MVETGLTQRALVDALDEPALIIGGGVVRLANDRFDIVEARWPSLPFFETLLGEPRQIDRRVHVKARTNRASSTGASGFTTIFRSKSVPAPKLRYSWPGRA